MTTFLLIVTGGVIFASGWLAASGRGEASLYAVQAERDQLWDALHGIGPRP